MAGVVKPARAGPYMELAEKLMCNGQRTHMSPSEHQHLHHYHITLKSLAHAHVLPTWIFAAGLEGQMLGATAQPHSSQGSYSQSPLLFPESGQHVLLDKVGQSQIWE